MNSTLACLNIFVEYTLTSMHWWLCSGSRDYCNLFDVLHCDEGSLVVGTLVQEIQLCKYWIKRNVKM